MEIKKIGIWSFVRIILILSLVFGLIAGIFMSIYISRMASVDNAQVQAIASQSGVDASQIVTLYQQLAGKIWITITLISVIASFIASLIAVLIYNLTAKWWGGIKIELEK